MKPLRLYINNFLCYDNSYIDFSKFSSALIVGKINNNDSYSNGVGKSTIFKAIEFVLFNYVDINFEHIIREDQSKCNVTFDFDVGGIEYRISRSRTIKGVSDLTLLRRQDDVDDNDIKNTVDGCITPNVNKNDWEDLSCRRSSDTEKEIFKLIKLTFKSFRSTLHIVQNDWTGLPTATPEKRKAFLKEALDLLVYSKLEKLAKDKQSSLDSKLLQVKGTLDGFPDLDEAIKNSNNKLKDATKNISQLNNDLVNITALINATKEDLDKSVLNKSLLENDYKNLISTQKTLKLDISKLHASIQEFKVKKNNVLNEGKQTVQIKNKLIEDRDQLLTLQYDNLPKLQKELDDIKSKISSNNALIKVNTLKYDELKIPLPNNSKCEHCRQDLSDEHRNNCQEKIDKDMGVCKEKILESKSENITLNKSLKDIELSIKQLQSGSEKLDKIKSKLELNLKDFNDKNTRHNEYKKILAKLEEDLVDKDSHFNEVNDKLKGSFEDKVKEINTNIDVITRKLQDLKYKESNIRKKIESSSNDKAVLEHSIIKFKEQIGSKKLLEEQFLALTDERKIYPYVIQAFSSTGIPNVIIQNVLDDLQSEANIILNQLKPGLQLSFVIEKVKGDGSEADTLDIVYSVNGRNRYYEQLSGAMKLAVIFSLKIGLAFLLQKMSGLSINLLLLDEVDQALDKAGVDAFADIVKFFQQDFTILVITHNDRLKDKFSHTIMVDQNISGVSKATLLTN